MAASTPPMSPGKRILRVVGSPGRYVKTKMRAGSQPSSVFNLVVACLGAGLLTIPYTFYANGFVLGNIFILSGGFLSIFTGYLLAIAAHKTNGTSYEEIALATMGPRMQTITSICMIPTNMGFALSYFVIFKSFVPYTFGELGVTLPNWCDDSRYGQIFWAGIFFVICFVVTIPRNLSELRFASLFSIMLSIFIVLVVIVEGILAHGRSSSIGAGFKAGAEVSHITASGIFGALPTIIFSYMYQINVPALYSELEEKSLSGALKVLVCGTVLTAMMYISAGMFSYAAFADGATPDELDRWFSDNMLAAPYHTDSGNTPIPIYISLFGMTIVVTFAVPFVILPTKDSIESVRSNN